MPSTPLAVPAVGPFYGAAYFSAIISSSLYGVTCVQTYLYFLRYQEDPVRMKGFVVTLWALNTVHQAMTISGAYKYIRAGLESPLGILYPSPDFILGLLPLTLVALPTQGFFIYRIYLFSRKNIIAPLVWAPLALYELVATLLYLWKALFISNGLQAVELTTLGDTFLTDMSTSYCSVAAGVDVSIAISLVYLLARRRTTAGHKNTSKMLQRLMIFTIISGIWTAVFAMLAAILVRVFSSNLTYIVFAAPLCPLYCNTLLANLNARAYIKGEASHHTGTVMMMSAQSRNLDVNKQSGEIQSSTRNNLEIWKSTEVVTFSDTNKSNQVEEPAKVPV